MLATFDHPHFTLVLADASELTLARLDRCFDSPIPNPGRPYGRPNVNPQVEFYLRDDLLAQIISPLLPAEELVRVGEGLGLR